MGQKIVFLAAIACLVLTSGLAAACFVKAFGITFLGMPRSRQAAEAKEVDLSMRLAMFFLSGASVALGLCASHVFKILLKISSNLFDLSTYVMPVTASGFSLGFKFSGAAINTPLVALVFFAVAAVVTLSVFSKRSRAKVITRTWDCGYYQLTPRTQYSGTAFSKPFRIAFSFFLLPYRKAEKIRETFYHVKQFTYETRTTSIFKRYLYQPLIRGIFGAAHRAKAFQMGSIHWYLGYMFVTLLVLIIIYSRG